MEKRRLGVAAVPFFSVILPTYNRASMLVTALKTLVGQTFEDFEVLIVDDGSTDATPEIIKDWTKDSRFKYRHVEHLGNMPCRNLALRMASGVWITNIDSDDLWLPDRLKIFADYVKEHPDAGFVFSNGYLYRYGRLTGKVFDGWSAPPSNSVPGHYAIGRSGMPYLTTNLAIPKALYEKYGLYREDMLILDNELYARMLADGVKVGIIETPLAVRRVHEGQVTHQWAESYPEAIAALKASKPSPEVFEREKENLVVEFADYLWRNLERRKARDFMRRELPGKTRKIPLYSLTFIPTFLLSWAKQARKFYLILRRSPFLANAELKEIYRFLDPFLVEERARERTSTDSAGARRPAPSNVRIVGKRGRD